MKYFEFSNLVKIVAGEDALCNLEYELDYLGMHKPLVITDAMLYKLKMIDLVKKDVKKCDLSTIYYDVPIDSSLTEIVKIKNFYEQKECDGILAVGGGSVIDTAKMVKLMLSCSTQDLEKLKGCETVKKGKYIPFIVIPTTSGTGAEMTSVAVIKDTLKNKKYEFITSELLPSVAILDVKMTLGLPPTLTASTAIDALCHAIEAFSCNQKNPISDSFSVGAIEKIYNNVVVATVDGKDKTARLELSVASLMAGLAFSNSMVGLAHAIAHSLGGMARVSHGDAISLVLVEVLKFNFDYCKEDYAKLLLYLFPEECINLSLEQRAKLFISKIAELLARLRNLKALPSCLRDRNVADYQLPEIAKLSINDGAILLNKRNADKEQILEILKRIF